jgi:adenylate cyclase
MNEETGRLGTVFPIDLVGEADFVLGASRVSPSRLEVSRAGLHETLEPRIMQVLVALYQADGKVVSRDELIARCWEGRIVGEDAITRAVGRLRRLSEADDGASFHIETIPKIGFRLVAAAQTTEVGAGSPVLSAVESLPVESPEKTVPGLDIAPVVGLPRRRGWRLVAGLSLPAVAAFALAAWLLWPAKPAEVSVAVLPFENLSGDPNQEFFSDGMTEEITAALAKVPGIKVIGRTSAFQFKSKDRDLAAIGQALHATHLIEGSVRKDGNQVRITAQLIKTDTGLDLWTESYNRELKGIFALQEDIATAIAAALRVPLGLAQGERLVANPAIDPESYQNYLRAKALYRSRYTRTMSTAASALLEQVVAKHPDYAPAWALLAYVYALTPYSSMVLSTGSVEEQRGFVEESLSKAEAAARRAIALDPHNADAYAALGFVRGQRGNLLDAERAFKLALSLDPLSPETLHHYSGFLAQTGQLKPAIAMREQVEALDPFVPAFNESTALSLEASGENAKALTIVQNLPSNFASRAREIASIYAAMGRYKEAANAVLNAPRERSLPGTVEIAARLLSTAPNPAPPQGIPYLREFSFVFLYVGLPERALENAEHAVDLGSHVCCDNILFWQPAYASARKTERFKALVRKLGLVDYWRVRGWPEFCHPVGTDDYACK